MKGHGNQMVRGPRVPQFTFVQKLGLPLHLRVREWFPLVNRRRSPLTQKERPPSLKVGDACSEKKRHAFFEGEAYIFNEVVFSFVKDGVLSSLVGGPLNSRGETAPSSIPKSWWAMKLFQNCFLAPHYNYQVIDQTTDIRYSLVWIKTTKCSRSKDMC